MFGTSKILIKVLASVFALAGLGAGAFLVWKAIREPPLGYAPPVTRLPRIEIRNPRNLPNVILIAADTLRAEFARQRVPVLEDAVAARRHRDAAFGRIEVHVARAARDRALQQRRHGIDGGIRHSLTHRFPIGVRERAS